MWKTSKMWYRNIIVKKKKVKFILQNKIKRKKNKVHNISGGSQLKSLRDKQEYRDLKNLKEWIQIFFIKE